jgi:dCTP deaminase
MILSDSAIDFARQAGRIVIEPYDPACLGGNSYDVHLSKHLATYALPLAHAQPGQHAMFEPVYLDVKKEPTVYRFEIPEDGYLLRPGVLYLASTEEYTETLDHVPYLDGRSSVGRYGVSIHVTAGRGDVGFKGHWTMEITVVHPIKVYAGMPIGQLTFHSVLGDVQSRYDTKPGAKYAERDPLPQPSRMFKNFTP